ncbi:MAG: hypothetical protein AABW84_02425 [Nanoarchaeota archaeon]
MDVYVKQNRKRIAYEKLSALTKIAEAISGYLVGFSDNDNDAYQEAIFYLSVANVMAEDGRYDMVVQNIKRANQLSPIDLKSHPKTERLVEQFPNLVTIIDTF